MKKRQGAQRLMPYPPDEGGRCGCKVSWKWYSKESDAKAASKAAEFNGRILEAQGYDFGYQAPGHITKITNDGRELFEVTIP